MIKVAVTGGGGQLGRSIKDVSPNHPDLDIIFIDIDTLDITDREAVDRYFSDNSFDVIVNCAAYTNVDRAETEPLEAARLNAAGAGNIAKAARKIGARLIHISTDYVFRGDATQPYRETDATEPLTVYGSTKLEGEREVQSILDDAVIVRTAWLYSGYGKNFFLTMRDRAAKGDKVSVVNDQRGTPTLARDLAETLLKMAETPDIAPGIYHYTGEGETTWYGFARAIYAMSGQNPDLVRPVSSEQYASKTQRPLYSVLDKQKIKDTLNIRIPHWERSLSSLINNEYGT